MFLKEALFRFIATIDGKLWNLPSTVYTCELFTSQGVTSHFKVVFTFMDKTVLDLCIYLWFYLRRYLAWSGQYKKITTTKPYHVGKFQERRLIDAGERTSGKIK